MPIMAMTPAPIHTHGNLPHLRSSEVVAASSAGRSALAGFEPMSA